METGSPNRAAERKLREVLDGGQRGDPDQETRRLTRRACNGPRGEAPVAVGTQWRRSYFNLPRALFQAL